MIYIFVRVSSKAKLYCYEAKRKGVVLVFMWAEVTPDLLFSRLFCSSTHYTTTDQISFIHPHAS